MIDISDCTDAVVSLPALLFRYGQLSPHMGESFIAIEDAGGELLSQGVCPEQCGVSAEAALWFLSRGVDAIFMPNHEFIPLVVEPGLASSDFVVRGKHLVSEIPVSEAEEPASPI